ncbi:MAG: PilW family protein [Thauera sp.]|nr:PilW family protein [Thauera sp.]
MLVLSGVTYVFFSSRTTYGYNESLSRLQENGRVALDALSYDIRMAGFLGCGSRSPVTMNVIANDPPVDAVKPIIPVTGYSYGDAAVSFVDAGALKGVANSDVLVIHRSSPKAINLVGQLSTNNANIQIACNPDKFKDNDVLLVTDCRSGDLFRATTVSEGKDASTCDGDEEGAKDKDGKVIETNKVTIAHAASANSDVDGPTSKLSKTYGKDAQIMRFEQVAFFLRDSGRKTASGAPIVSLYRRVNGVDEEIVDGVVGLRAFFELENGGGVYARVGDLGADDWPNVVSVQLHLLLASQEQSLKESQSYWFPSAGELPSDELTPSADKLMRQTFVQTIALRNRLP